MLLSRKSVVSFPKASFPSTESGARLVCEAPRVLLCDASVPLYAVCRCHYTPSAAATIRRLLLPPYAVCRCHHTPSVNMAGRLFITLLGAASRTRQSDIDPEQTGPPPTGSYVTRKPMQYVS